MAVLFGALAGTLAWAVFERDYLGVMDWALPAGGPGAGDGFATIAEAPQTRDAAGGEAPSESPPASGEEATGPDATPEPGLEVGDSRDTDASSQEASSPPAASVIDESSAADRPPTAPAERRTLASRSEPPAERETLVAGSESPPERGRPDPSSAGEASPPARVAAPVVTRPPEEDTPAPATAVEARVAATVAVARYVVAIEARDLDRLRETNPLMLPEQAAAWSRIFAEGREISAEVAIDEVSVDGPHARVEASGVCRHFAPYATRPVETPLRLTVFLQHNGVSWRTVLIDEVKVVGEDLARR
ncbi:MAG: hypothetical protein R3195_08030 [Gemmatimonadota bacterium]|nr:hypothetical protein [Gemmatimonadota bacterium]